MADNFETNLYFYKTYVKTNESSGERASKESMDSFFRAVDRL